MGKKIAVVGSINMDYFIECDQSPKSGETILGKNFFTSVGGKGANQAVAASRLGGKVSMFGSLGNDEHGKVLNSQLQKENININQLQLLNDITTGAAFIQIFKGENKIIVVPGANELTNRAYSQSIASELLNYDIILFQLEIPIETLEYLVPILYKHNKIIIVNPAPAKKLGDELLNCITYLTPNEHEYSTVTNQTGSMNEVLFKFPNKLIITCGNKGVLYFDGTTIVEVPAMMVDVVDTTGAGDTFTGAFTVAVSEGKSIEDCVRFGIIAAGLSVTKKGAQTGMPSIDEVARILKEG
ncbi:ribokinase [Sporosarcina sp. E16_8]|uniref:ribokinase n=1 Tax=Sporosarcina sp. E16_8 TaxID=2789295 RepID=UPI001A9361C2|nr:ribokinase [Sporosarcina sp. E16_8]MBO0587468.1 ribokinase [Sporosarcina sp. E16_8]